MARTLSPAIIIMDINLPGISSLEAPGQVAFRPIHKNLSVLALSAAASELDKLRGLRAGFAAYLTKPVNVETLIATLEKLLQSCTTE